MRVALIGYGWLGHLFKSYLLENSPGQYEFILTRSRRSDAESIQFNVNEHETPAELKTCDYIFFLIPPSKCNSYPMAIKKVLDAKADKARLILISSTSVFANDQKTCTESTTPKPDSDRSISIRKGENIVLEANQWVIRSGGQFGENRHPVNFLARKVEIAGGLSPVNMIHSSDLVRILELPLINLNCPKVLHAVSPYHPTKQDFYTQEARKLSLELPPFKKQKDSSKVIDSQYLKEIDFPFLKPEGI